MKLGGQQNILQIVLNFIFLITSLLNVCHAPKRRGKFNERNNLIKLFLFWTRLWHASCTNYNNLPDVIHNLRMSCAKAYNMVIVGHLCGFYTHGSSTELPVTPPSFSSKHCPLQGGGGVDLCVCVCVNNMSTFEVMCMKGDSVLLVMLPTQRLMLHAARL